MVGYEHVSLKFMHKVSVQTVTFLFATHRLVMMIICAKLVLNPIMHNKVIGQTRAGFTEVYDKSLRTVTLTFDLAIWFLFATHRLVLIIICAKLFSNPTMHNEVYAQNLSVDCDLDL